MATILTEILEFKRQEVAEQKKKVSADALIDQIEALQDSPRGFMKALREKATRKESAVIAEIKKASPSEGVLRENFDPISIAEGYQRAGATCLSVITDEKYFQGSKESLVAVRRAVNLPILRKEFIVDEYQIIESRALGADAILLIVAALTDQELLELTRLAHDLGIDVLVEVHTEEECQRALKLPVRVIGVNNRNLNDFSVDLATSTRIKAMLPNSDYFLISESGIATLEDINQLQQAGIYSYLIGSALMKSKDPSAELAALLGKDEKRSELF